MRASNMSDMSYCSGSSLSVRSASFLPVFARQLGGTVLFLPFWQCRLSSFKPMFYTLRKGRARARAIWWCKSRIIVIMLIIASICSMLNRLMYDMLSRYHMLCWGSAFLTRNRARPPRPGPIQPPCTSRSTHSRS